MSNVICTKCGATGVSKCPYCRGVFPDNTMMGYIRAVCTFELGWYQGHDGPPTDLMISYTVRPGESLDDAITRFIQLVTDPDFDAKKCTCRHSWVFKPGCSSSIDCGHGNKES